VHFTLAAAAMATSKTKIYIVMNKDISEYKEVSERAADRIVTTEKISAVKVDGIWRLSSVEIDTSNKGNMGQIAKV
jgi:hypothetical protein